MDIFEKAIAAMNSLAEMDNAKIKDVNLKYKTKDTSVSMTDSDRDAYIQKFSITNDASDIPEDAIENVDQDLVSDVMSRKLRHIFKENN